MILSRFSRLFQSLNRTRKSFSDLLGKISNDLVPPETMEELETLFLSSDMGIQTTKEIMEWVGSHQGKRDIKQNLCEYLQSILEDNVEPHEKEKRFPAAIFVVGVNGTGKTTSAVKLAFFHKKEKNSILLIAADTYRAAAVEQLRKWSAIADVDLICNESARDPSSIVYDGLKAAETRGKKYAIIDTAGRLHTSRNLMTEVEKMYRVARTKFETFHLITYLTIDANLGQNSIVQASTFKKFIPVDGIILTKMDGTAKGGIIFPIYRELKIPVKFVGIGETVDDLIPFNRKEYVQSLLNIEERGSDLHTG